MTALKVDSEPERKFAAAFESRTDIKFYLKLPSWFKIETPLGTYNPGLGLSETAKPRASRNSILVRETKSSLRQFDLRNSEEMKIWCGKAHFDAFGRKAFMTKPANRRKFRY